MTRMRAIQILAALFLAVFHIDSATAQEIEYGLVASEAETVDTARMAQMAEQILGVPSAHTDIGTEGTAALLLAAGEEMQASELLGDQACTPSSNPADMRACLLAACAKARHDALVQKGDFDQSLDRQLTQRIGKLDNIAQERFFSWAQARDIPAKRELDSLLRKFSGEGYIGIEDAAALIRAWVTFDVVRRTRPALNAFVTRERQRRFHIDESVLIRTAEGHLLHATLVRPKDARGPLPTTMYFTIYSDPLCNLGIAANAAAHGYTGLVVNARGKLQSPDAIRPYEVEVDDTVAAINWARGQGWSDGRVGMYGGSYTGFAAWAATKKLPTALKTIVPYVAAIPGQGLPMENNIFLNANYGWPFYVTNNRSLDRTTYDDPERWSELNDKWYLSGRRYRDIDSIDGTPNPWLQRWLQHPDYDSYWQEMVPFGADFAKIDIPILSITGYYDDGQISSLRYLKEHYRFKPDAEHYLVIGPYDHFGAQQAFKDPELRGYKIDPVAQFDTSLLTFAWFDHIFRGKERPALLKNRINYQVMGANVWRHAPSLKTMSETSWNFYLTDNIRDGNFSLSPNKPDQVRTIRQIVDFADRSTTSAGYYPYPIKNDQPDLSKGIVFETAPFEQALEVSGAFSGVLRVRINKGDFDFMAALYEKKADGSTFALSYYVGRASHVEDLSKRKLLTPGAVSELPFERTRVVSRKIAAGSRLLLVVDVIKNGFHQINYGTGGEVSDETIADAKESLRVEWLTDSLVRVPVTIAELGPTGSPD